MGVLRRRDCRTAGNARFLQRPAAERSVSVEEDAPAFGDDREDEYASNCRYNGDDDDDRCGVDVRRTRSTWRDSYLYHQAPVVQVN